MKDILKDWAKWSLAQFPEVKSPIPPLNHLKEEVKEAIDSPNDVYEYADIIGLCISAWCRVGSIDELEKAIKDKLDINKGRKWHSPDSKGIYRHKQ